MPYSLNRYSYSLLIDVKPRRSLRRQGFFVPRKDASTTTRPPTVNLANNRMPHQGNLALSATGSALTSFSDLTICSVTALYFLKCGASRCLLYASLLT